MPKREHSQRRNALLCGICVLTACLVMAAAGGTFALAQVPEEDEHSRHHPGQEDRSQADAQPAAPGAGMMQGMECMMPGMCVPARREIYPSLMAWPELSPAQRAQVAAAAQERMQSGTQLLAEGLEQLVRASDSGDYAAMQRAVSLVHEGTARFDSGLAAERALAEGRPPREVALQWFKEEMRLPQAAERPTAGVLGVSWFHFGVMLSLVLFAAAMLWLYFLRMRRASSLLQSLTGAAEPQRREPAPATASAVAETAAAHGRKWSGQLRVGRIFRETPDVKTFRLTNPLGGVLPFSYLPGQFITVAVPGEGGPVRRSYSIASSPTQCDYTEITVKQAPGGVVSSYLHSAVREGDLLDFSGPTGAFTFIGRECRCILLIAGGIGITPLMSVLRYLLDRSWNGDIFLIYGCRTPQDIVFREELEYLQRRHPNLLVAIAVAEAEGSDWKGARGMITRELIADKVPNLPSRYVHVCGPVPMMEATKRILAELGIPPERIKTEAFGPAAGKIERTPPEVEAGGPGREGVTEGLLPTVTFVDSNKSAPIAPDQVLLEVAEDIGVDIDYSCRAGTCGVCRVKLLSGEVSMAVEDGLQPGDRENNIILACQARATQDIAVKA